MLTRRHLLATGLALTAVFPITVAAAIQAYTPGLAVPRRSTLIAQNGDKELSRIIAGTRAAEIRQLMDRALAGSAWAKHLALHPRHFADAGPYCISGLERARPDQRFALPASRPNR